MVRREGPLALALGLGLVACSPDPIVVSPVIETPTPGAPGAAFPDLDEIELSVAHEDGDDDILTATFQRGERIELLDVPEGDNLVLHVTGRLGGGDVAYGRSCPFSLYAREAPPTPRIYFGQIVHWSDRGASPTPIRVGGAAAGYHDGRMIFLGGADASGRPSTAIDVFDPARGQFEVVAQLTARVDGVTTGIGDGGNDGLVVLGGLDPSTGGPSSAVERIELDATAERRVERLDSAITARHEAAVATLTDGRVFLAGGHAAAGTLLASTAQISATGTELREYGATLAVARYGATATRLSDDLGAPVLIAGGRDAAGRAVALAELWKPLAERFADPAVYRPMMVVPRWGHAAVRMPDGSVLILGGLDADGQPVRQLERFTLDAGFVPAQTSAGTPALLPAGLGILDRAVTPLVDGRLMVTGGRAAPGGPALSSVAFVSLNPLDGSVAIVATAAMAVPRAGHSAGVLCDGSVLVEGGTTTKSPVERYVPGRGVRR